LKRLLIDQGLPRSAVALPGQAGFDVVHVSAIRIRRSDNADILQRARAEARACIMLDADFHSLLAISGARDASVIRIRKEGLDATALATLL
jgi:predicted nuclease of predicted toxin-antitoxin system